MQRMLPGEHVGEEGYEQENCGALDVVSSNSSGCGHLEGGGGWSVNVLCCANRGIQNQNQNQNQKNLPGYLY